MANISFNDVSLKEQYSEILSRSDVDISADMGGFKMELPIVSANMPQITEATMASCMYENGGRGILHRACSIEDNLKMYYDAMGKIEASNGTFCVTPYAVGVSIGVDDDLERFTKLYDAGARLFCIDVAHGHHIKVKETAGKIFGPNRNQHTDICLIIGNVATEKGARDLAIWGASIVKVGIGPGCFISGTQIKTIDGYKNIEDVAVGDMVLTHRGKYKEVMGTTNRVEEKELYVVNGEKCTSNHEFYVLNRKYSKIVNDDNIEEYAEWIPADKLTKDYMLLKVKK